MSFVPIQQVLGGGFVDQKVAIRGWVYRKREGKQTIFLLIRDSTGIIQCPVKKESSAWDGAGKVTIESSLALEGTVSKDARAPGGYEVVTEKISIIGLADLFPITKDKSEEFLRDVRHLWLRSRKMNLVMKVRSEVQRFAHEFFKNRKIKREEAQTTIAPERLMELEEVAAIVLLQDIVFLPAAEEVQYVDGGDEALQLPRSRMYDGKPADVVVPHQ